MVTDTQRTLLAQDLPRDVVKTREQAGQRLSYVDGWYAVTRANEVFGPDGWSYAVREMREVYRGTKPGKGSDENTVIIYEALVAVTALGITREDVGIGQCDASIRALAQGIEKARKEAVTDGLKRALRTFGPSFGLALYDKDQRDVGISRAAMDLRASLEQAADPDAWAKEHGEEVRSLDADERDELRALVKRRREESKAAKPAVAAVPALASLGIEQPAKPAPAVAPTQPAPARAASDEERAPSVEESAEGPLTIHDLLASIRLCTVPGEVADRWVASTEERRAWSAGEREACWAEAVARVMTLLNASKTIASQKLKAAVEARTPKGPGPKGGAPKPESSRGAPADVQGDSIGTRETQPAPAMHADAWRTTAGGITDHVAGISAARHLESSARQHLRDVPEVLQLHALHVYAGRLQRISHDGTSALAWDECVHRAETWLREGPRVAVLPSRARPAARRKIAAGGR